MLDHVAPFVVAGATTADLDRVCHDFIAAAGARPAPLHYAPPGHTPFPKSICASVNHQVCHGVPSDERHLKDGDILNLDVTVIKDGFHGDTGRMFFVGEPSVLARRLCEVTRECLDLGIAAARDGNRIGDIGAAIQQHAHTHRFSVVREYCGHGLGRNFHEPPQVPHFGIAGTGEPLRENMIFTIEPMINAGQKRRENARRRLDGGHARSPIVCAMGAHRAGHKRRAPKCSRFPLDYVSQARAQTRLARHRLAARACRGAGLGAFAALARGRILLRLRSRWRAIRLASGRGYAISRCPRTRRFRQRRFVLGVLLRRPFVADAGAYGGGFVLAENRRLGRAGGVYPAIKIVFACCRWPCRFRCNFSRAADVSESTARIALIGGLFWYELAIFAHKPFTEFAAAAVLLCALAAGAKDGLSRREGFFVGAACALTAALRMQYLPLAGLAFLWAFGRELSRAQTAGAPLAATIRAQAARTALIGIGGGVAVLFCVGLFEFALWGRWFHSYYFNAVYNLALDQARVGESSAWQ